MFPLPPPVIPISVIAASPGPLTTQPMMDRVMGVFIWDNFSSKISIIGVGMITTPGITYRMFQALASRKINILVISTSEIKISVLVSAKHAKRAIAALHKEFKLD